MGESREDHERIMRGSREDQGKILGESWGDHEISWDDHGLITGASWEDHEMIMGGSQEDHRRITGGSQPPPATQGSAISLLFNHYKSTIHLK